MPAELAADLVERPPHRLAVLGPREVGRRLVAERRQLAGLRGPLRPGPSRPGQHGSDLLGVAQQVVDARVRGRTQLEERLVRRVLQQPAHQVGHARQQGAVGSVDAHPVAAVHQRPWMASPMP